MLESGKIFGSHDLADFYESISRLDKGVELVLKALDDTGKAGNTLVIFVSDNGMPFHNAKTTVYDPGIHLPFIVRSPLQKKKGSVNNAMVNFIDVTPTILALCDLPVGDDMDGAVIEDAFEPAFLRSHPTRRVSTYELTE